ASQVDVAGRAAVPQDLDANGVVLEIIPLHTHGDETKFRAGGFQAGPAAPGADEIVLYRGSLCITRDKVAVQENADGAVVRIGDQDEIVTDRRTLSSRQYRHKGCTSRRIPGEGEGVPLDQGVVALRINPEPE